MVNIRCYFLFSVAIDATNSKMEATNALFDAANSLFDAKMEATHFLLFDAANSLFDAKMKATNSLFSLFDVIIAAVELVANSLPMFIHNKKSQKPMNYLYISI